MVALTDELGSTFQVIAAPCNQFGGQEPGTPEEILAFASSKGVKFPMTEKLDVRGDNAHPIYKILNKDNVIDWNFNKFLVDKDGNTVQHYGKMVEPNSIKSDIQALLSA